MEIKIACGTWVKDDSYKVLKALEKSYSLLSIDELSKITGLSTAKVKRALRLLKASTNHMRKRREFL